MPVQQGSGARSFLAGFDYGDAAAFGTVSVAASSTVTLDQTIKRSGAGALRTNSTATGRARFTMAVAPSSLSRLFYRAYLYVVAYPATNPRLILGASTASSATHPQLQLNTNGTLSLQSGSTTGGAGTIHATTAAPIPLATWTCIELGINAQDDRACLRVDGVEVGGWLPVTAFAATASLTVGTLDLNAAALDLYWDDIAVDLEDWCGPGRVERVRFASAVETGGTATFTGGGDLLSSLDKADVDDSTYLTMSASGHRVLLTPGTFPTGTLRGVQVRGRVAAVSAASAVAVPVQLDTVIADARATSTAVAATTFPAADAVWTALPQPLSTAVTQTGRNATPLGGLWTDARIRRLVIGIGHADADALNASFFALEVDNDDTSALGPPATRLLIEGFETGRKASVDVLAGTTALVSTGARTGTYALQVNPTGATTSNLRLVRTETQSLISEWFYRTYVYATAYPTVGPTYLLAFLNTGGSAIGAGLQFGSDGSLQLRGSAAVGTPTAAGTIPLNVWSCVEVRLLRPGQTFGTTVEVRVDGVTVILDAAFTMPSSAPLVLALGAAGSAPGSPAGMDVLYDDIAIDATDWCGPGHVGVLTPDATTATGAVLGDSGPTTGLPLHEMVDEIPPDDDTTYFELGATLNVAIYYQTGFTDPVDSAVVVRGVSVAEEAKGINGTAGWARYLVCSGERDQGSLTASSATINYSSKFSLGQVSPFRGAWTPALLSALEYQMRPGDATDPVRLTQLMVQYDYDIDAAVLDQDKALSLALALDLTLTPALGAGLSLPLGLSLSLDLAPGMSAALTLPMPLEVALPLAAEIAAALSLPAPLVVDLSLTPNLLASLGVEAAFTLDLAIAPSLSAVLALAAELDVAMVLVSVAQAVIDPLVPGRSAIVLLAPAIGGVLAAPAQQTLIAPAGHGVARAPEQ